MLNKKVSYIYYIIATFFGVGFLPKAPGTFASIIALIPLLFIPFSLKFFILTISILIITFISIPIINYIEQQHGSDAQIIVIDEVIGILIIYISPIIPITTLSLIIGLILFRIFDISKPWIIGKLNKKKGAMYVILDDIIAGIFSAIILHIFYFIYRFIFLIYLLE